MSGVRGRARIAWIERQMRMLAGLREELARSRPFVGRTIGICLHIEPKTAVLCRVLRAGGAELAITGSPGTTQDDVADALSGEGDLVYGRRSDGAAEHARNVEGVLDRKPDLLLDNGADLVAGALSRGIATEILGATEETTTGANRLREELEDVPFPVIVINDSPLKRIVENQHGVGQTVVAAFQSVSNLMVPGRRFVVIGYGWCGRGIARTLKALGAQVGVVDAAPLAALEAALDGMRVGSLEELLPWGSVFFTVTGRPGILTRSHFAALPDRAILANAGHFRWEIDVDALRADAASTETVAGNIESFTFADGRSVTLLAGGEMLNLAAGGGNPAETMDIGLSLQARSLALLASGERLAPGAQPVPEAINARVAAEMLRILSG
jgi:adenosylhomocysteinase